MDLRDTNYILQAPATLRLFRFKTEDSKKEYRLVLDKFFQYAGLEIGVKTPSDFVEWAKAQPDNMIVQDAIEKWAEGRPQTAQLGNMSIMRSLLKSRGFPMPSMQGRRPKLKEFHRGYTREELQSLLSYLDDPLEKLYLLIAKDSGLRAQDILRIRVRHIEKDLEKDG